MSGNSNSQAVPWGMDQTALRAFGQNPFDFLIPDRTTGQQVSWRWATVTQASPLRIRLDGDNAALIAEPTDLGGPRAVGDRVYAQIVGRRVVVFGPNGGTKSSTTKTGWINLPMSSNAAEYQSGSRAQGKRTGNIVQINGELKPATQAAADLLTTTTGMALCQVPEEWRPTASNDVRTQALQRLHQGSGTTSWLSRYERSNGYIYAARLRGNSSAPTDTYWLIFSLTMML